MVRILLIGKTQIDTTLFIVKVLFSFAPSLSEFWSVPSRIVAFSLDVVSDECVELDFASLSGKNIMSHYCLPQKTLNLCRQDSAHRTRRARIFCHIRVERYG